MSDGRDFMQSLVAPAHFDSLPKDTQEKMLQAYDSIASQLSDRSLPNGNIVVKGAEYRPIRAGNIGAGGFGSVKMYERVSLGAAEFDPAAPKMPDRLAVKEALDPRDKAVKETPEERRGRAVDGPLAEARALANLAGTGAARGADNAVKLEGVLRTPEGKVMVAMGVAPGGNLSEVTTKLEEALASGKITAQAREAALLTLMKDVIAGGERMGDAKGMVHLDIRRDNLLLDGSGHAQIADPGQGRVIDDMNRQGTKMPSEVEGNKVRQDKVPIPYMPPEVLRGNLATPKADV
jgi:serine/threonine protein kinase